VRSATVLVAALLWLPAAGEQDEEAKKSLAEAQNLLKGMEQAEVTHFRLDPASGGKAKGDALRGWMILQRKALKEAKDVAEVRAILSDPKTYAEMGAKCFEPGMGFRFKGVDKSFDLVICLKCSWIYVYVGDEHKGSWALSKEGVARLLAFYQAQGGGDVKK
jgi:hypothetical protein